MRIALPGLLVTEHAGQQPRDRIDDDGGGKFAAAQHVVADRHFLERLGLDDPLIEPLVTPGDEQQPGRGGEFARERAVEAAASGAQDESAAVFRETGAQRADRAAHGLVTEHHAGPAAVRPVVHRPVPVRREGAR